MTGARYRLLSAEELAALPEQERAKYRREREAFDREVETHKAALARGDGIEVTMPNGQRVKIFGGRR